MAVLSSGKSTVVAVDFKELDNISAPALNALLQAQKFVEEKRYTFYIQNISEPVKEIFVQTGFIDLFEIR
jgi:anti-anti-sigma regulatory factor